jgi:hypothetical protein
MVWIRSDAELAYHGKLENLLNQVKIGRREAVGSLHLLWWFVAKNGQNGLLPKMTDVQIAGLCDHNGNAGRFVSGLIECGFLDRSEHGLKVHDWDEWISEPIRKELYRKNSDKCPPKIRTNVQENVSSAQESLSLCSVLMSFPVSKNLKTNTDTWFLTEEKAKEYQETYPGVDIISESKKALQWIKDNPTRKKTYSGMPKFLNSWMARAQNSSKNNYQNINIPVDENIKKVIHGWKILNQIPTDGEQGEAWDLVHIPKLKLPASELISLFGDWEKATEAMEYVFMRMKSKKLDCTLNTIVKHSDLYREYKNGQYGGFK